MRWTQCNPPTGGTFQVIAIVGQNVHQNPEGGRLLLVIENGTIVGQGTVSELEADQ